MPTHTYTNEQFRFVLDIAGSLSKDSPEVEDA